MEQTRWLSLSINSGLKPLDTTTLQRQTQDLVQVCKEYEDMLAHIQIERLKLHWTISCVAQSVQNQLAAFRVALNEIGKSINLENNTENRISVMLLSRLLTDSKIIQSHASDVLIQLLKCVYPNEIKSVYFSIPSHNNLCVEHPTIH
jgi:hypothetical protein